MVKPGTSGARKCAQFSVRSVLVAALLAICVGASAVAQRGGGGGHASAGGRGGFSAPSGGGFHGGFSGAGTSFRGAPGGAPGRVAAPQRGGYTYGARPGFGAPSQFRAPGTNGYNDRGLPRAGSAARSAFFNRAGSGYPAGRDREGQERGGRERLRNRDYRGYGYRYGYPGFYNSSAFYSPFFFDPFFGFGDPFYGDNDGFWNTGNGNASEAGRGYDTGGPAQGAQAPADLQQPYPEPPPAAYAPGPETEPGPWAQPSGGRQTSPPIRQEDLVTIVFKDGRPVEHIRNYALTRSALLITDARMREIPLDEIDMATTQRVNRASGVDFRLPQSY